MHPDAGASNQIPMTFCPRCEALSITYRDLDEGGGIRVRCLSCDTDLGADSEVDEVLGGASLWDALGYEVVQVKPRGGAGGCRTGGGGGCSGCGVKAPPRAAGPFRA